MSEGMINKIISQLYILSATIFYFWIQLIDESMAIYAISNKQHIFCTNEDLRLANIGF